MSTLNKEIPDFSLIKGKRNRSIGVANKILPAKTNITPITIERNIIKNLIFFEIFLVLALANQDKTRAKIIKIIIPKKIKFIY